jgi:hypothetical protein
MNCVCSGPGYGRNYGSAEVRYGGSSYPDPNGLQQVCAHYSFAFFNFLSFSVPFLTHAFENRINKNIIV